MDECEVAKKRIDEFTGDTTKKIFLLHGPSQSGKSTVLRRCEQKTVPYFRGYDSQLKKKLTQLMNTKAIIIDDAQYCVHSSIFQDLLGKSSIKIVLGMIDAKSEDLKKYSDCLVWSLGVRKTPRSLNFTRNEPFSLVKYQFLSIPQRKALSVLWDMVKTIDFNTSPIPKDGHGLLQFLMKTKEWSPEFINSVVLELLRMGAIRKGTKNFNKIEPCTNDQITLEKKDTAPLSYLKSVGVFPKDNHLRTIEIQFVKNHLQLGKGISPMPLFVVGNPGTGKKYIIEQALKGYQYCLKISCSVRGLSLKDVVAEIAQFLNVSGKTSKNHLSNMENPGLEMHPAEIVLIFTDCQYLLDSSTNVFQICELSIPNASIWPVFISTVPLFFFRHLLPHCYPVVLRVQPYLQKDINSILEKKYGVVPSNTFNTSNLRTILRQTEQKLIEEELKKTYPLCG